MQIRGLDIEGDWVWGIGQNAYKVLNDAISQNIETKIREWKNDCYFNVYAGIDWINRIGYASEDVLRQDLYSLILSCEGVVAVNELSFSLINRSFTVTYNIQTQYSQSVQNSIQNTI